MKSLLKFFFARQLTQHPDSFALTRAALWNSIATAISLQQSMGKSVWLVAYFPETYLECQKMLEEQGVDYHVETAVLDEARYLNPEHAPGQTRLFLAELLQPIPFEAKPQPTPDPRIAMMVIERHPCGAYNEQLIQFARSLPGKIEIGHFLAMDDQMVRQVVPTEMVELMKTMGLSDNDLISSTMVTRLIRRRIKQTTETNRSDEPADSAAQWYQRQRQRQD